MVESSKGGMNMDYRQNLFNAIKILFLMVILAELAVLRMAIMPSSVYEYILVLSSIDTYLEHIILSIVFSSLGALIFLKKA